MKPLLIFVFAALSLFLSAQQNNFPLTIHDRLTMDACRLSDTNIVHTSFQPAVESFLTNRQHYTRQFFQTGKDSLFLSKRKHPWIYKKLLTESFVDMSSGDLTLRIDPVLNVEEGTDSVRRRTYNTRGIAAYADIGKTLSIQSIFVENQSFPELYLSDYIKHFSAVPGEGRIKYFKKSGFDYAYAAGNLSFSPVKQVNIQFGNGKQFVGDGYRSLLLSDFSFYHPTLRVTSQFGKWQYVNLWMLSQNMGMNDSREQLYGRKYGSISYLSYAPWPWFEAGVFESVLFRGFDSSYRFILPVDYLNPLLGYRYFEYGMRNSSNVLAGFTFRIDVLKSLTCYGQFALDDYNRKGETGMFHHRTAFQAGVKINQPFHVRNLFLLAEYNYADPYIYAPTAFNQSYSGYNEPLAHPLGAGFREQVLMLRYLFHSVFIQAKYSSAQTRQQNNIEGFNISDNRLISDYDLLVYHSSAAATVINLSVEAGLIINHKSKLELVAGIHQRNVTSAKNESSSYVYAALRTPLFSRYNDF